jgi:lipoate-protein ligase A
MLDLVTDSFPSEPTLDIALSEGLLRQIAARRRGPTVRIFRPGATVAFGRRDGHLPGFPAACKAAHHRGFVPVIRSVGGHAAAYDEGSLVVEHIIFEEDAIASIEPRFDALASRLVRALSHPGADARIGELPGEYCPGAHSINVRGRHKVVGMAQRTIKNAALTSAVIVVRGGARIRTVIESVCADLAIPLDPATVGALEDTHPTTTLRTVQVAVEDAFRETCALQARPVNPDLEQAARATLARRQAWLVARRTLA